MAANSDDRKREDRVEGSAGIDSVGLKASVEAAIRESYNEETEIKHVFSETTTISVPPRTSIRNGVVLEGASTKVASSVSRTPMARFMTFPTVWSPDTFDQTIQIPPSEVAAGFDRI